MLKAIVTLSGKTEWIDRKKHPNGVTFGFDPEWSVTGPRGGRLSISDELYYMGTLPANYPVPATLENADTAIAHTLLTDCRYHPARVPCVTCIENWLDTMEYGY